MKIKLFILAVSALLAASCSGSSNAGMEPADAIDGYSIDMLPGRSSVKNGLYNLDGTPIWDGKKVRMPGGETVDGSSIFLRARTSSSVGGFFRVKYASYSYLIDKELNSDGGITVLGPFEQVGMFYDELVPAIMKNHDGVGYVDKAGNVEFWLDEALGVKGVSAESFLGGLSIVSSYIEGSRLYGAVDTKGRLALPLKYRSLKYVGSGLWAAEETGKNDSADGCTTDIINDKGEAVFSFPNGEYDIPDLKNFGTSVFHNGYGILAGKRNDDFKIVNNKGRILYEYSKDKDGYGTRVAVPYLHYDKYFACQSSSGRFTIINAKGKEQGLYRDIHWMSKDFVCYSSKSDGRNTSRIAEYGEILSAMTFEGSYYNPVMQGGYIFWTGGGTVSFYDRKLNLLREIDGDINTENLLLRNLLNEVTPWSSQMWMPEKPEPVIAGPELAAEFIKCD